MTRHRLIHFRSDAGESKYDWIPYDVAPGDVIVSDSVKYYRVLDKSESHRGSRRFNIVQDEKPVVSHSSPRWHGVKATGGKGFYKHYTHDGKPVRTSRSDFREAQIRAADHGETIERARDVWGDE